MNKTKNFVMLLLMLLCSVCFAVALVACDDPVTSSSGTGGGTGGGATDEEYYVVNVEMIAPPTVNEYAEGDLFDPTGMELKVVWNDGWEQIIKDGKNCIFSPAGEITAGTEVITATFDDYTFTLPVQVNKIESIQVKKQPARTLYATGEAFSTTGMEIVAMKDNGDIGRTITDYTLSSNATKLSTTDTSVTVSYAYQGETLTCSIPVKVFAAKAVATLEAEDGEVVNGEIATTGVVVPYVSGNGFVRHIKQGGTITVNVPATKATTASLRFVVSSYEADPEGGSFTIPLQLNEIVTVTFNGNQVTIGDEEILSGGYDDERGSYSRYCHWYEIKLDNVQLNAGNNPFVITSKVGMTAGTDLHSTLFDSLRVFYADATAAPEVIIPGAVEITEATTFQAEDLTLKGLSSTVKANGQSSGLFATMEANGDTDPGFILNFTANSTATLTLKLQSATRLKISIYGSSTKANTDVTTAALIGGVALNGQTETYNEGTCFVAPSAVTPATMATFSEYVLGEYDFIAGENNLVITFTGITGGTYGGCFIDRLVLTPVA